MSEYGAEFWQAKLREKFARARSRKKKSKGGVSMNLLTSELVKRARKWIGHTETAKNYSPQICVWLRNVHILQPAPWCAAFAWCMLDESCRELGQLPARTSCSRRQIG